jgi:hypothetical protein
MAVMIAGRQFWVWRAVDDEGEVLDLLVQRRRDKRAAAKHMRKLLKKQGFAADVLVTDKLRSYDAAKALGLSSRHEQGLRKNNRAENSHRMATRKSPFPNRPLQKHENFHPRRPARISRRHGVLTPKHIEHRCNNHPRPDKYVPTRNMSPKQHIENRNPDEIHVFERRHR